MSCLTSWAWCCAFPGTGKASSVCLTLKKAYYHGRFTCRDEETFLWVLVLSFLTIIDYKLWRQLLTHLPLWFLLFFTVFLCQCESVTTQPSELLTTQRFSFCFFSDTTNNRNITCSTISADKAARSTEALKQHYVKLVTLTQRTDVKYHKINEHCRVLLNMCLMWTVLNGRQSALLMWIMHNLSDVILWPLPPDHRPWMIYRVHDFKCTAAAAHRSISRNVKELQQD